MNTATAWLVGAPILGSLALMVMGVAWRSRRWFRGRPAAVGFWRRVWRLPAIYMGPVHAVSLRPPYSFSGHMHRFAAGGVVVTLPLALLVHVIGVGGPVLAWILLAGCAVTLAGAAMAWRRRNPRPSRLSGGRYNRLPYALMGYAIGLGLLTATGLGLEMERRFVILATALLAWGCFDLIIGMAAGPMKHAVNGALHLVCHPRPERFDAGGRSTDLRPVDLDGAILGAESAGDFAWNRLLGFDACVECGRCKEACPAFAAGQPLNPKKLIQVLASATDASGRDVSYRFDLPFPRGRQVQPTPGGADRPIVGAMIHPDTLWACTTCRACVEACPMMIEHVDAIVDLRRFQAMERGAVPGKGGDALDNLRLTDNAAGRPAGSRTDFAVDLDLRVLEPGGEADVLLWLGEGAFELRGQRTLRALIKLLQRAGVDVAVLGTAERDCGDVARRLGDEATFQALARANVATLAGVRFGRIVTADPHALHVLRNEYPALGGSYEVVHHTALLDELVAAGRLAPAPQAGETVTYHDPCYLARYNAETAAPRRLLAAIGATTAEMPRHGRDTHCCGWGGGGAFTDVPGEARIPDQRMDQVREAGTALVAVACPNCAVMLEGVQQPRADVRDVAELLLDAVERASRAESVPT